MPAKNAEILHVWDLGTTGLVANMTAVLERYPSGTSQVTASESVALAEVGATGAYTATYTPVLAQTYILAISESTTFQEARWEDIVSDVASAATANNAYCAEADVVAFAQMGDYTASTIPTEAQVLGFMEMRAGEIYNRLTKTMGSSAPGPTGYSTTIDTSTDPGLALSKVTKLANAIGAAMDAVEASGAGESPARSERVSELAAMYVAVMGSLADVARAYIGYGSFARNHFTEGRVTKESWTSRTQAGLTVDDSTTW